MTKRVGDYELGPILGQGSFGLYELLSFYLYRVRQATNLTTKEEFAIKIIDKEKVKRDDSIESLKREIQILMMINHPNIVRLIEVLASKTKIYLVLEWIKGGELFEEIRSNKYIPENIMKKYFRQIVRALKYCQQKQIAHRDLKPENILICNDKQNIKVNDFGLSSLYLESSNMNNQLYTTCGTVHYLAPEVIQSSGYDGHKADIWSLGVILFFACAGYLPFEDDNVAVLLDNIISGTHQEFPKYFTKELKDIISKILIIYPNKRITLEQIIQHPWFQGDITTNEKNWFVAEENQFDLVKYLQESKYLTICTKDWNISWINKEILIREGSALSLISLMTGKVIKQLPSVNSKESQINYDSCFTIQGQVQETIHKIINLFIEKQPTYIKQVDCPFFQIQCTYKHPQQFQILIEAITLLKNKTLVHIDLISGCQESYHKFLNQIQQELRSLNK